ncbi:MAG: glutamyl-tRNA reductase [Chlorobiaceae bacterium]|nr:glutamyl-tRNA reductase [Chlorobiaceae bacterium]MBA4310835.1 glutamyl-tRNA reductase [Chlorobiaceae bacterium]
MNLLAISLNHHTASVDKREAVHLNNDEIKKFLDELKENYFSEGFILSTCNRTEIYGIPIKSELNYLHLTNFLLEKKAVVEITDENFQKFFSCSALNHLFRVTAGIDSLLVGDNQILGQVKESFSIAEEKGFVGFLLKRVFDHAMKVGKRAKTETLISEGAITVSYAAVQLIEKIFSNLSKKSALVIGVGETGEIATKHLRDKGIGKLTITNRTFEKAEKLAEEVHAKILPFANFKESLHEFDIIISATSAKDYILSKDEVKVMMKKRGFAATVLMDIAIPRDIDPNSKNIDNVFYHDIDSLSIIVDQNLKKRKDEIPKVQQIIMEELISFFSWFNSLEIAPTIKSLRDLFEEVRISEVDKYKNKFSSEDVEKLDLVTKRIINKLLHHPTTGLKKVSELGTDSPEVMLKIALVRDMFGLDKSEEETK